jgi:hypothetical protein
MSWIAIPISSIVVDGEKKSVTNNTELDTWVDIFEDDSNCS